MSNRKKVVCKVSFRNVGQSSQSRSRDQNLCYHQKVLVITNTHAKYERPLSNSKEVMCRVRPRDQNLWYHQKGIVINTHAKYESPLSNGKEVMCRVKVFQM